ncbi:MAG: proton-conducting transporter membrane subunit [Candidatus Limnocylindrales bacterium]
MSLPSLVAALIALPAIVGAILILISSSALRNAVVVVGGLLVAAISVAAAVAFGNGDGAFFGLPGGLEPGQALLAVEIALTAFVVVISLMHRRFPAPILALTQLGISVWLEVAGRLPEPDPSRLFWFDRLSLVMVLVVGIIGPLICINAIGYMRAYHRASPMIQGRRTVFFSLLFVFLAGMFGLVVSNYLPMMLVFWEITTICSFLLIGYTRTEETVRYAFRALNMNLLGGLGFGLAIVWLSGQADGLDLARLTHGPAGAALLPAIALLAFAGITKSAQMPFSSWLIGAMYAPSPTSALLHSSTMVKAGVFLLLRLSPAMSGSTVGYLVAFVGLLTFLFVSLVAVTEQNTKKVLAYSTIGSLGLIVGCAGIGTPELAWAGVMIIIFHALAKGLLFLVVGTIENRLYTKNMENFDALMSLMPRISTLFLTGIAGMFVAPFGLVIAKWTAIRAFLLVPGAAGAAMVVIMAFGSSLTIFYWGKLLMKVLSARKVTAYERSIESRVSRYEWATEIPMAIGVIAAAACVGLISDHVVGPYALSAFSAAPRTFLALDPATLAVLMAAMLFLPLLSLWVWRHPVYDHADFYAGGRSTTPGHVMGAALGGIKKVTLRNYYLDGVINGALMFRAGTVACGGILVAMVTVGMVARP